MNFLDYKEKYQEIKQTLEEITDGSIPDEVVAKLAGAKSKDDAVKELEEILEFFESSIYFFHNSDGSFNREAFYEFYEKFKNTDDEDKVIYKISNRVEIKALSKYLQNVDKIIQDSGDSIDNDKIFAELDKLLATRKE